MPGAIQVTKYIVIPESDLTWEYTRAGGPGGQHVNTTDTAVRLRFDLFNTAALNQTVKERIRTAHPGRLTSTGEFLLTCSSHRARQRNITEVSERLAEIVRAGLVAPKRRRPTKPSRAAKRRRMDGKTKRGAIKKGRGRVPEE